jgi:lipoyl(octanoyl) transferase
MAIDQALLERAEQFGENWLRLYAWEPYCLSFGRHEPAARRYDRERIAEMGLDTVRRPTGGRAVWHSRELTYAVATSCRSFGSLQHAYGEIHGMLAGALQSLGFEVSLAPPAHGASLAAGPCFATAVGGEVLSRGHKLVGSAQLRRNAALLQHGSILMADEQHMVTACTKTAATGIMSPPPSEVSRSSHRVSVDQLIHAICSSSRTHWGGSWREISVSDEVLELASRHMDHFRSPSWTWER